MQLFGSISYGEGNSCLSENMIFIFLPFLVNALNVTGHERVSQRGLIWGNNNYDCEGKNVKILVTRALIVVLGPGSGVISRHIHSKLFIPNSMEISMGGDMTVKVNTIRGEI